MARKWTPQDRWALDARLAYKYLPLVPFVFYLRHLRRKARKQRVCCLNYRYGCHHHPEDTSRKK